MYENNMSSANQQYSYNMPGNNAPNLLYDCLTADNNIYEGSCISFYPGYANTNEVRLEKIYSFMNKHTTLLPTYIYITRNENLLIFPLPTYLQVGNIKIFMYAGT